ncbi:hypothetical protein [Phenylobacterium sp.]|uniref:hypothetical protein n=1 Tax=Phenylobacterium sp. TaxID=1871053 RepID=UPI003BA9F5B6
MHAAEKAHGAVEATEDAAELCALIAALGKAGRALRMSIALETKLIRDAARDAREAEALKASAAGRAVETRKARVAGAVDRMIWTELDPQDAQVATGELHERLDAEALDEGFADEPVEAQIERIAGLLGLSGEPIRRYVPASLRRQSRYFREAWGWDDEDDDEDDADGADGTADEPDDPAAVAAGSAAAAAIVAAFKARHGLGPGAGERAASPSAPSPPAGGGRLAPPMDLPSWDCDDDTS